MSQRAASVKICRQCQNFTNSRNLTAWPTAPFNFFRVHVDFFYKNKFTFLIIVDQKSKWVDVKLMTAGTAALETISKLRDFFSVFGLPAELVSDNGPPFSSNDFVMFCQANGIKPVKSPPYHPQSNGAAERNVQTVKKGLEKALFGQKNNTITENVMRNKLQSFLFNYRITPSPATGIFPAECVFKIKPKTRFDLLKPVAHNNAKGNFDLYKTSNILYPLNAPVFVKNKQTKLWQRGVVKKVLSFSTYLVDIADNIRLIHVSDMRRNLGDYGCGVDTESGAEQCHHRGVNVNVVPGNVPSCASDTTPIHQGGSIDSSVDPSHALETDIGKDDQDNVQNATNELVNSGDRTISVSPQRVPTVTRSSRVVKRPSRLDL